MSAKIPPLNSGYSVFKWVQVPAQKHGRRGARLDQSNADKFGKQVWGMYPAY